MEYVIKRYDFDISNLVWINHDMWRPKEEYRMVDFEYKDGKCDIKGNKTITVEQLQDMIKKSGDYIC